MDSGARGARALKEGGNHIYQWLALAARWMAGASIIVGRSVASVIKCVVRCNRRHDCAVLFGALALVLGLVSYNTFVNYEVGLDVYCQDEYVTSVSSQSEFCERLKEFEKNISKRLGEPYSIGQAFSYKVALVSRDGKKDSGNLDKTLMKYVTGIAEMSVLKINGEEVGANESGERLLSMLEEIKVAHATGAPDEVLEFAADVSVEHQLCRTDERKSIQEIESYLTEPMAKEVTYTIQKGDTLWAIAPQYGMSLNELVTLNGIDNPAGLKIGDEIVVSKEVPRLSVLSVRTVEYTREIPYETEYTNDASIYLKQKKVKVAGVAGEESVVAEVVSQDGMEIERRILSTRVLKEPVTQKVLVGTKTPPPTAATGKFMRPASGRITSRFGYRGREFHTGLDIANSVGTPIVAADGGTVTFAGWKGTYGYCVIINHGNGYQTLYAHNSKLFVSKGDKVAKGSKIAAMGSTGRSTGSHCHFEVIVNGAHKNPANYI